MFGDRGRVSPPEGWEGVRIERVRGEYSDQFIKSLIGGMGVAVGFFLIHKLSGGTIGKR